MESGARKGAVFHLGRPSLRAPRTRPLFDHLVGEHEQVRRNGEAERLGGL
jgi:hypothetical protein